MFVFSFESLASGGTMPYCEDSVLSLALVVMCTLMSCIAKVGPGQHERSFNIQLCLA